MAGDIFFSKTVSLGDQHISFRGFQSMAALYVN